MSTGSTPPPGRVILLEQRGETSRFTHAEIDENGRLLMLTQDIGRAVEEHWGDSDYEFWVTLPAAAKDRLLLALLAQQYTGRFSAVDEFRAFLDAAGIEYKFENWI